MWTVLLTALLSSTLTLLLITVLSKPIIAFVSHRIVNLLYTVTPKQNPILGPLYAMLNTPPWVLFEIGQRAESGNPYHMSPDTRYKLYQLDKLMFNPAQVARLPCPKEKKVQMHTIIGPAAAKPLALQLPVMVGGMAWGIGLSLEAKLAICQAASQIGIAVNSGHSGYSQEERTASEFYIAQYSPAKFTHADANLAQADMIEVFIGQGANPSVPWSIQNDYLPTEIKGQFVLNQGENPHNPSSFSMVSSPKDWSKLVGVLKEQGQGIPVAAKFCPSASIEDDLSILVEAGFDVIVIDGAESGSGSSPEFTIRNYGLPLIYALPRAISFLQKKRVRNKITVVASGGMRTSGDIMKVLALGADAVYLGTSILIALLHTQVNKGIPWHTPFAPIEAGSKLTNKFNTTRGVTSLYNFLEATKVEMEGAVRALGKSNIHQVNLEDMVAIDLLISKATGVPFVIDPKKL